MSRLTIENGNFKFIFTDLEGVTLIEPRVRGDERGFFMETYKSTSFNEAGITADFVQDNHSGSKKGIIRGLHLQFPYQEKLVRAIDGEILDIAVQVYPENSPNFGKYITVPLGVNNHHMVHIGQSRYQSEPVLYAHGFLVTSDFAQVSYKASNSYNQSGELGLNPFDKRVSITYPYPINPENLLENNLINQRDFNWPNLETLASQIWECIPERRVVVPVKKHV